MNHELSLQQMVCDYLRLQYPTVLFHSDYGSGLKLTMGQAIKNKRLQSGRSWPDLFLPEPRGGLHGLFLELKKEGTCVYKKDGSLSSSEHIREQAALLAELERRGFRAQFGIGFSDCKQKIDHYLKSVL